MTVNVRLEPGNPEDLDDGELSPLIAQYEELGAVATAHRREEVGYGVTWHEVLNVWIEFTEVAGGTVATIDLLRIAVQWAQDRWRRDKEERPDAPPRPRTVNLYGPDGQLIKRVTIDEPDGEPTEDVDPSDHREMPSG